LAAPEHLTDAQVVRRFEQQGWVAEAPHLADQMTETDRNNSFRYISSSVWEAGMSDVATGEMTEHEGLVALDTFLAESVEKLAKRDNGENLASRAASLRRDLNFMGEKEFGTGVRWLKSLWKSYLDADANLQLCIPAAASLYAKGTKSDKYLIEQILAQFSDEERKLYEGRIITNVQDIKRPPEHTKIIVADDYVISGEQMTAGLADRSAGVTSLVPFFLNNFEGYRESVEVNLLAVTPERLKDGLKVLFGGQGGSEVTIPIKACYRARTTERKSVGDRHLIPLTSVHSSADYGFGLLIRDMVAKRKWGGEHNLKMPALTNIVRDYHGHQSEQIPEPAMSLGVSNELDNDFDEDDFAGDNRVES
jgi:hypothetical protein